MSPTKTAAGTNKIANRLSSFGPRRTARECSHPCTRLNRLPAAMTRPTINGKVPDSTPADDQPMPLSRLETTTAAPNAPVMSAVAASRLRPETIITTLVRDQPTLVGGNLVGTLDVVLDELAEGVAGQEGVSLRGPLDIFLPFRRGLHLLHQIDIEDGLICGHFSGQPDGARLLELRNGKTGFDAGRDIVPVLCCRDLGSV